MSENPENPSQTPMDRKVDQAVEPVNPPREKYNQSALGNLPLADKPEPLQEQEPTKLASFTIAEIERTLSSNTLKPSSLKIDQFTQAINRKQDLRLRNLSRQLGAKIKQDQEALDPKQAKKLTDFDVQSQTMRMVSANAAMGSYQFQKTLVLPYMRKSLALGYQKVSLLKDIVKGIGSVEKSVVSKLEAIKINTASTAPRQKSYFKRLMDDVSFLNMRRIAGNVSAYTMDGYEKLYKKYVSPKTLKMHRLMSSDRKNDGVNGVRRTLTGKLNSWRRTTRDYAKDNLDSNSKVSKAKGVAASVVSRLLGGSVKETQKIRLDEGRNKSLTNILKSPVEDLARFNPFSSKGPLQTDLEDDGIRSGIVTQQPQLETHHPQRLAGESNLQSILMDWRAEHRKTQDKVLEHLSAIDDGINGRRTRVSRSRDRVVVPPFRSTRENPTPRNPVPTVDDIVSSLGTPTGPRSLNDQFSRPVRASIVEGALPPTPAQQERQRTSIGSKLSAFRQNDTNTFGADLFRKMVSPLYTRPVVETTATPTTAASPTITSPFSDTKLDRSFFTTMFERLGNRVTSVSKTVEEGNKDRTKFEKVQSKWKELADKLRPKEVRKNSYEDLKSKESLNKRGFLGRASDRFKTTATSAGSKLLSGDVIGAGGDVLSDLFGWAKDEAADAVGEKVREKAGEALSRTRRRARVLRRRGVRGLFRRGARASVAAATTPKRGIMRKAGSLLWRGAKASTKGVGKVGLKGAGSLLKGGFSLAKSVAPSAAVGLAGGYLNDYFEKNTEGATKRLGTTAGTMAQWGATGATIGSIIPGLGTGVGAAIGAGLGAIAANTDLVSAGLSKLGNAVTGSASFMWTSMFGKDAKLDAWGKVKKQEERSLIGTMYGSVFGQDAKYAKSGDLIRPGKKGLIPGLYQGVDKFFFGDKNKDGKFKAGTSILAMMGDSVLSALDTFKNGLSQLPGQILELFGSLKEGANNAYNQGKDVLSNGYEKVKEVVGNIYKGKAAPVSDAKTIVKELVPEATITSHRRKAGGAGKAGANSWHVKSGAAIDVAPVKGMDFETFKRKFTDAGYPLIEAIDETDPATMKKTGATGPHWHIVLGQRTSAPNANADYQGPGAKGANWGAAVNSDSPLGSTGPMKGGYVSKDSKQLFNSSVAYLMKKGWSKNAALGIAANLYGESKFDTKAVGDSGKAYGIAQWHPDRAKDIANKFGKPLSNMSLNEQLDAVDWELRNGKHNTNDKSIPNGTAPLVDTLNKSPSMEHAVQQLVHRYERPNNKQGETSRRINEAYGLVGSMGQDTQTSTSPKPTTQPKQTQKQPAANTQTAQKDKPKNPQAKPAPTPPAPVVNDAFLTKFDKAIDKWTESMSTTKKTGDNNTVISTPVSISNRSSSSSNSMSLKKERIRTGA